MCVAGLYFVFLLFEDVIIGYYSTNATSQDQELSLLSAFNILRKNTSNSIESPDKKLVKRSYVTNTFRDIFNTTTTNNVKTSTKWQVETTTNKHYDFINLVWRKTKVVFLEDNIHTTTAINTNNLPSHKFQEINTVVQSVPTSIKSTTPSNIEFYYLDDTQDGSSPSFVMFHLTGPYGEFQHVHVQPNNLKFVPRKAKSQETSKSPSVTQEYIRVDKFDTLMKNFNNNIKSKSPQLVATQSFIPLKPRSNVLKLNNYPISDTTSTRERDVPEITTVYDKIKFFEMYDQNTETPIHKLENKLIIDFIDEKDFTNKKILLEHVDQSSHDHDKAKHSKKHVTENPEPNLDSKNEDKMLDFHTMHVIPINISRSNKTLHSNAINENGPISIRPINHEPVFSFINKTVSWSDYPFVAVYIYEPLQVFCDAAGISAHWLVASGSCLSRVSKYCVDGRSAFVAYCGDQWWQPERVAYVKYSFVHPRYHHHEETRKHLYNIGIIQVANSMMSSCAGWAPVALMSHKPVPDSEHSMALAVGWGLDRFDTRYGATDLPKLPLNTYKSNVYFDSCPGNFGYSLAMRLDSGGGVENVYCLALPPYSGEETDPVHGGLLLIDGKLISLYLQEERRSFGEQSAQYTGLWRLIPWVMEMAKETEESDTFIK